MTNFTKGKYPFLRLGVTLSVVAALVFAFGAVRAESDMVIKQSSPAVEITEVAKESSTTSAVEVTEEIEVAEEPSVVEVTSPAESATKATASGNTLTPKPAYPTPEPTAKADSQRYNRAFTMASPAPSSDEDTPFVKLSDIICLTVDDEYVQIKAGEIEQTISFELSNLNSGNILSVLQQFITETASSQIVQLKWAGRHRWDYPQSNAVIVVDAKNDATVADVRRVRDWARYAVAQLRNKLSLEQINVEYFYLCERDCNLIERAVPTQVILTPNAQKRLDLSPETDVIYSYADRQPGFMGKRGQEAKEKFVEWMKSQDAYKKLLKELPKDFISQVRLIIEKDGSLHAVSHLDRVLDGRHYVAHINMGLAVCMSDIMENICAASPRWKPAKHNGEPVRMEFTMYMRQKKIVFGGWDSGYYVSATSAPRGVVVNPKQSASRDIKITKITFTDEQTVVDFRIWGPPSYWVRLQSNAVLDTGNRIYPIRDALGTKIDVKYWIPKSGTGLFQLIFPPIECKVDKLSFYESGWYITDIDLSTLQQEKKE